MYKQYLWVLACTMLLGSWNGQLALWEPGAAQPEQYYPIHISTLPPADQKALEAGICVNSQRELSSLLEDYLS